MKKMKKLNMGIKNILEIEIKNIILIKVKNLKKKSIAFLILLKWKLI